MNPILIIPAYNEGENIERVVRNVQENFPQYDYIVVNDGSADNTAKVCMRNGFNFLDLPENVGLSGAFQAGMKYAYYNGYDCAVQYDGDGQHDARYIADMVALMEQGDYDIVIGSRFVTQKKPKTLRMLGSNVISAAIKITTRRTIKDPTSGMRLYNRRMMKRHARMYEFGPEPDTLAFLARSGAKIGEVQVEMLERTAGKSYLNFARSMRYMTRMCMSIFFIQWFRKPIDLQGE
ncbi:MAG: glycosyltransferase family 2 protein [Clostridia bacterium]|nr:glycosyltransferase family 2 protein [Clostridia bacterium]